MKKIPLNAHTPKTLKGSGDNYGTGVRNPVGRMREDSIGMNPLSKEKLKKAPKSLA